MITSKIAINTFNKSINDYHIYNSVDSVMNNPYGENTIQFLLFKKNWIDNVQWHLEDLIRVDDIDPKEALTLKRRIDKSNQERTNTVEKIDDFLCALYTKDTIPKHNATINTETPAWVLDRLSILTIRIFHFNEKIRASNLSVKASLTPNEIILNEQLKDLSISFDELMFDLYTGEKKYKLYRQIKLYKIPE